MNVSAAYDSIPSPESLFSCLLDPCLLNPFLFPSCYVPFSHVFRKSLNPKKNKKIQKKQQKKQETNKLKNKLIFNEVKGGTSYYLLVIY